jgi:sugar lactone lactonase YvrE
MGAFSNPSIGNFYKSLDSGTVNTLTTVADLVSTAAVATKSIVANSAALATEIMYTSTLYINSVSSFLRTRPDDYQITVAGNEYISGPILVTGAASYRGNILTGGDLFSMGNISSKLGTIYVGGDVTVGGSIRGQRGNQMRVNTMSIFTSSGFAGPVTVQSTVGGDFVNSVRVSTPVTRGNTINVMSSIIFATPFQSMRNTLTGIEVVGVSATIPSTVSTSWLAASNSLATSNLSIQSFGPASTLQYLTLGSASMINDTGSLVTSSIQIGTALIGDRIYTGAVEDAGMLVTQAIEMNDSNTPANMPISFSGRAYDISGFWLLSSIGANGTLTAPYTTLSTITVLTHAGTAIRLDTNNDNVTQFTTGSVSTTSAVYLNGASNLSIQNVFVNNSRGAIMGSQIETIQNIHCSSLVTDHISTGKTMRFLSPVLARLQRTFISTVNSGTMNTSSLHITQITAGYPEYYSTINPSTPWLITSSFNQSGDPFMKTTGLGTYFDKAIFRASMNQNTYYSVVNPEAQDKIFLSTPYINSIAGTGTPGTIVNGQVAQFARLGTELSKAAGDASGTIYVGSKDLGWKIQKIDSAGRISTVAGNYRYFYGDGADPLGAAFSPQLAVSVSPQSQIIITDISNVRIRLLTPDPFVITIAGTGDSAYSGDGGAAYLARFSTPTATASDSSGNIYVADTYNQIIRRIVGSTISTFAGIPGLPGNTGDGGAALAATLNSPFGIATDLSNNVYFTDLSNCAIRRITPQGTINLIAGNYTSGFGGDGGPAVAATLSSPRGISVDANKNIYFCDTGNSRVRRIDAITQTIQTIAGNGINAYGGDNGLAVNARLSTPTGVATDTNGNVYIADTNNQCIRFVSIANNTITTVAGQPTRKGYGGDYSFPKFALLNSPSHIALDRNTGNYYFADDGNARIRYVDPSINVINTVAGNGSPLYKGDGGNASGAVFGSIKSLTRDSANNLYIVDDTAHVIRAIDLNSGIISNVAGTGIAGFSGDGGPATLAYLSSPQDVIIDSSANLYFTDRDNQRVRKITPAGIVSTVVGTGVAGYNGDSISSISATLNNPTALAFDSAQNTIYIGDLNNNRIRTVNASSIIATYAGSGDYGSPTYGDSFASTMLASTTSIVVNSNSEVYFTEILRNGLWRLNRATNTVQSMNTLSDGAYFGDSGPLSNAYLSTPTGLSLDRLGNFLIADQGNSHLRGTYTFGYPQTPVYLTMEFTYTNYFASTGTASISLNGNRLATFYGSNLSNDSYRLSNANVFDYPLQYVNPVYRDTTPFIEITQTDSYGYTKLDGTLTLEEVPSQGLLENTVKSDAGIIMNAGCIRFPNQNNGITIENRFNDVSTRSILYTGQLLSASDPVLKEQVEPANTSLCYSTMERLLLKRYKYSEPYISTFRVKDVHRLGFLTTDAAPVFPKSVTPLGSDEHAWISSMSGLDTAQLKYSHYGVTQHLMGLVSTLEAEVEQVARSIVAQRNTIL